MLINYKLLEVLDINITNFEKGEWGSAVGRFKVPYSILKQFKTATIGFCYLSNTATTKGGLFKNSLGETNINSLNQNPLDVFSKSQTEVWFPWLPKKDADNKDYDYKTDDFLDVAVNNVKTSQFYGTKIWEARHYNKLVSKIKEELKKTTWPYTELQEVEKHIFQISVGNQITTFDAEKCFNEIALTYLNAIFHKFSILRMFASPEAMVTYLLPEDIDYIKKAVYNAIEFASKNNQFWENINGSGFTQDNFSITIDSTAWLMTDDMFGAKARHYIENADLETYEVYPLKKNIIYELTKNGNVLINRGIVSH